MKDLINNFNGDIEELKKKYKFILDDCGIDSKTLKDFIIILDYTINYLEENYEESSPEDKAYLVTLVYKLYKEKKYLDIEKTINVFTKFYEHRFEKYAKNYPPVVEIEVELAFIDFFVRKL